MGHRTFYERPSLMMREAPAGIRCCSNGILPNSVSISVIVKCDENKTQYQPCKDWLGQLFLIPGLVWKMVSPFHRWMCSLSGSQQPFSCVLGHFRHGDNQTHNRTTDPSASQLLMRRQSFAIMFLSNGLYSQWNSHIPIGKGFQYLHNKVQP